MRIGLLAGLALLLPACAAEEAASPQETERRAARLPTPAEPLPHLILYKSADDGGPEVFMEALIGGTLDLNSPCVAVATGGEEGLNAIVTTEGVLGQDGDGLYLDVGPHRLRHGDAVMSGGGFLGEAFPRADMLQSTVPQTCAGMPLVEMSRLYPAPPQSSAPRTPPPPPPPPPTT
ncbi:hypothetical protein [Sphingomicrobium arenosum]|uniref:hypothetical protein n=1 Tax=Sphingomicrobium arenosum TaxID=2233861 RepID=UPI00223EAD3E|nr:hypothetical protein [Sphingomicrobium arenosum]